MRFEIAHPDADLDAVLADLGQLLDVLGLGDHPRPEPPHEVFQRCLQVIMERENAITWNTTCLSCAGLLDSAYAERGRAERAEAKLAMITAYCRAKANGAGGEILAILNTKGETP